MGAHTLGIDLDTVARVADEASPALRPEPMGALVIGGGNIFGVWLVLPKAWSG